MPYCSLLFFLTFVIRAVPLIAAPHDQAPSSSNEAMEEQEHQNFESQNLILTEPPSLEPNVQVKSFSYPYHQSISPRMSFLFDRSRFQEQRKFFYTFGFNYMLPRSKSPHWEVGADLTSSSFGHVHLSRRWIMYQRSAFRPYYKLGALHNWDPSKGLASWTHLKKYLAFGAIGFEDIIKIPMSTRIEFNMALGLEDVFITLGLGYSWAW